jgi:hypothetical protein
MYQLNTTTPVLSTPKTWSWQEIVSFHGPNLLLNIYKSEKEGKRIRSLAASLIFTIFKNVMVFSSIRRMTTAGDSAVPPGGRPCPCAGQQDATGPARHGRAQRSKLY